MTIALGKDTAATAPIGRHHVATSALLLVAAVAPVEPSTVLNRGMWPAGLILLLRWRAIGAVDLLAAAFAAWVGAAALATWNVWPSYLATTNWWTCLAIFVAARCALTGRVTIVLTGIAYLCGCVWASVVIIQQTIEQGIDLKVGDQGDVIRLGVDGVNANYTAYALATGVAVAALLLHLRLPKRLRIIVAATIPVMGYAVLGTGTRGAQVSIVVAGLYLLLHRLAPRTAWVIATAGAPALLLSVALGVYGDSDLLWVQDYFGRATTNLSGRTDLWPVARHIWAQHLLTGVGPGMFPVLNSMYIGAHSLVLTLGAELGTVGLALFGAVTAAALQPTATAGTAGKRMAGLLLVAWAPIWLSGHWELSPAAWVVLAVWSRLSRTLR